MKQLLLVLLVLVILLTGIPVAMGMPIADCAECELGVLAAGACLSAVLAAAVALLAAQISCELRPGQSRFSIRLVADGLERPPRLA